jgi:hypothetical protein
MTVHDPAGKPWTPIEVRHAWTRLTGPDSGWQPDQRHLKLSVESYVVAEEHLEALTAWIDATDQRWGSDVLPSAPSVHVEMIKAYPELDAWPSTLAMLEQDGYRNGGMADPDTAPLTFPLTPAALWVSGTSGRDLSALDSVESPILAPQLWAAFDARWSTDSARAADLSLGRTEREFAVAGSGTVTAFTSGGRSEEEPHLLMLERGALQAALKSVGLILLTIVSTEKLFWADGDPHADRAEMHAAMSHTAAGLQVLDIRKVLRRKSGWTRTWDLLA